MQYDVLDNNGVVQYSAVEAVTNPGGSCRFSGEGEGSVFNATIKGRPRMGPMGVGTLAVFARVDGHWGADLGSSLNVEPATGPQSHLVNARTDPMWEKENNGKKVKGRLWWSSSPFKLKVRIEKRVAVIPLVISSSLTTTLRAHRRTGVVGMWEC